MTNLIREKPEEKIILLYRLLPTYLLDHWLGNTYLKGITDTHAM
jgi:hypothetical protein